MPAGNVQPVANLKEFFRDSLHAALTHQHVAVEDQTEHYVVNLLTLFARSEALYERTDEGARLKFVRAGGTWKLDGQPQQAQGGGS